MPSVPFLLLLTRKRNVTGGPRNSGAGGTSAGHAGRRATHQGRVINRVLDWLENASPTAVPGRRPFVDEAPGGNRIGGPTRSVPAPGRRESVHPANGRLLPAVRPAKRSRARCRVLRIPVSLKGDAGRSCSLNRAAISGPDAPGCRRETATRYSTAAPRDARILETRPRPRKEVVTPTVQERFVGRQRTFTWSNRSAISKSSGAAVSVAGVGSRSPNGSGPSSVIPKPPAFGSDLAKGPLHQHAKRTRETIHRPLGYRESPPSK